MIAAPPDRGATRLLDLLEEGRARARAGGRTVLVSLAEPAAALDALAAVAGVRAARHGVLRAAGREATSIWARPAGAFSLVGVGAAASLTAAGEGRFSRLDEEWTALRASAVVDDPSGGAAGVGPVLTGGFAFDAAGPLQPEWRGFPAGLLVLPRVQITTVSGDCWITTNVMVRPDGTCDMAPRELLALRAEVLAAGDVGATQADPVELEFTDVLPGAEWHTLVEAATAAIRRGGMQKVVVARAVRGTAGAALDPVGALRHLRDAYPSTYLFGIWRGDRAFIGATPERLVRLEAGMVRSSSLAGSIARGADAREDAARAAELMASRKDRSEHELVRRDLCATLAEVCDDVVAPEEPAILTLPHVHHLHTPVQARLRPGHSLLELVGRLHPTPAVGGAPRAAALEFIRTHERLERGWYAAPVGWVAADGGEFAVALRSALVHGEAALLYAGCGIVEGSDADDEFEESLLKLRPMQAALASAGGAHAADEKPRRLRVAAGGRPTR